MPQQQQQDTAIRDAIERVVAEFQSLCNRGDAATLAELYTERATLLPPGAEIQKGRDAIAGFWRSAFEAGVKNVALEALDIEAYGPNVAREIGTFALDASDGRGASSRVEGKYLVLWKREGGEWRLDADIWNTNE